MWEGSSEGRGAVWGLLGGELKLEAVVLGEAGRSVGTKWSRAQEGNLPKLIKGRGRYGLGEGIGD